MPPASNSPTHVEDDDDNLDDLDDVLEQFSRPKPAASSAQPAAGPSSTSISASATTKSVQPNANQAKTSSTGLNDAQDDLDAAFLEQLNQNMAALLSGLEEPGEEARANTKQPAENATQLPGMPDLESSEFKAFVEQMLRTTSESSGLGEKDFQEAMREMEKRLKLADDFGADTPSVGSKSPSCPASPAQPVASTSKPKTFQETLRETQNKLRQTDADARAQMEASTSAGANEDDALAAMLASLGKAGLTDDASLQEALEGMMSQLMSKDLLYEPIKDLCAKYPDYLATNAKSLPDEDLKRFKKQQEIVNKLAAKFESPRYSDEDEKSRQEVIDLMQQMQNCGAPPKDMMGDLPPGMNLGSDDLSGLLDGKGGLPECPQS